LLKRSVIIVAAGSGTRMNPDIPKQFLLLNGIPLLMHSVHAFLRFDPSIQIIIALPRSYKSLWETLCIKHDFHPEHEVIAGGETRVQSVKNALTLVRHTGCTAIHDGVRPLVSDETIQKAFFEAELFGNAVPVIPVNESVRMMEGASNQPVSRDTLYIVQTPQVFKTVLIKKAYSLIGSDDFTDDATILETSGEKIHLVAGNRENIKITWPVDLLVAEALLKAIEAK
jgi:2-C-methyl-D-erythritol 4-phosphate cytidylyltransferase